MFKTRHSIGKWTRLNSSQVYAGNRHVADCISQNSTGKALQIGLEDAANAKRIVACVNACIGINPEAVPDVMDALQYCLEILQSAHDARACLPYAVLKKAKMGA